MRNDIRVAFPDFQVRRQVVDVFVSHKMRKNTDYHFGFVRFKNTEEAIRVMKNLDGANVKDKFLKVSLARFDRSGKMWDNPKQQHDSKPMKQQVVTREFNKAYRDDRSYKDVVQSEFQSKQVGKSEDGGSQKMIDLEVTTI